MTQISPDGMCRFHEFTERPIWFSSEFSVRHGDVAGLLTEYALIISGVGILYLLVDTAQRSRQR